MHETAPRERSAPRDREADPPTLGAAIAAWTLAIAGTLAGVLGVAFWVISGLVVWDGSLVQARWWEDGESEFGVSMGVFLLVAWVLLLAGAVFLLRGRMPLALCLTVVSVVVVAMLALAGGFVPAQDPVGYIP